MLVRSAVSVIATAMVSMLLVVSSEYHKLSCLHKAMQFELGSWNVLDTTRPDLPMPSMMMKSVPTQAAASTSGTRRKSMHGLPWPLASTYSLGPTSWSTYVCVCVRAHQNEVSRLHQTFVDGVGADSSYVKLALRNTLVLSYHRKVPYGDATILMYTTCFV